MAHYLRVNIGTDTAPNFVDVEVESTEQVSGIYFRVNGGKLEFSTNNSTWTVASGVSTDDATAIAADILTGKTAYVKGAKVTGTMTNNGAVTQTLATTGASYTIPAGYHNGSGKVTATITNLSAANVKSGVSVGGVAGTFTSDATIVATDVLSGKIGYSKGASVTGTMVNRTGATVTATTKAVSGTNLQLTVPSDGYYSTTSKVQVAEANLKAENIKSGVNMFGIAGTLESGGTVSNDVKTTIGESVSVRKVLSGKDDGKAYVSTNYLGLGDNYVPEQIAIGLETSNSNVHNASTPSSIKYSHLFGDVYLGINSKRALTLTAYSIKSGVVTELCWWNYANSLTQSTSSGTRNMWLYEAVVVGENEFLLLASEYGSSSAYWFYHIFHMKLNNSNGSYSFSVVSQTTGTTRTENNPTFNDTSIIPLETGRYMVITGHNYGPAAWYFWFDGKTVTISDTVTQLMTTTDYRSSHMFSPNYVYHANKDIVDLFIGTYDQTSSHHYVYIYRISVPKGQNAPTRAAYGYMLSDTTVTGSSKYPNSQQRIFTIHDYAITGEDSNGIQVKYLFSYGIPGYTYFGNVTIIKNTGTFLQPSPTRNIAFSHTASSSGIQLVASRDRYGTLGIIDFISWNSSTTENMKITHHAISVDKTNLAFTTASSKDISPFPVYNSTLRVQPTLNCSYANNVMLSTKSGILTQLVLTNETRVKIMFLQLTMANGVTTGGYFSPATVAIASESGSANAKIAFDNDGVISGFTGLTPLQSVYCAQDGSITKVQTSGSYIGRKVGVALSATQILFMSDTSRVNKDVGTVTLPLNSGLNGLANGTIIALNNSTFAQQAYVAGSSTAIGIKSGTNIVLRGKVTGLSNLSFGKDYYLGTNSAITYADTGTRIGTALSQDTLLVNDFFPTLLII